MKNLHSNFMFQSEILLEENVKTCNVTNNFTRKYMCYRDLFQTKEAKL